MFEASAGGVSTSPARPPEGETATRRRKRGWRSGLVRLSAVLALLVVIDFSQPPHRQPSARVLLTAIEAYQATLSRLMPSLGVTCRFEPSCSRYAEGAIRARGTVRGVGSTFWRLLRCGPWTPEGTPDPPPEPRIPAPGREHPTGVSPPESGEGERGAI